MCRACRATGRRERSSPHPSHMPHPPLPAQGTPQTMHGPSQWLWPPVPLSLPSSPHQSWTPSHRTGKGFRTVYTQGTGPTPAQPGLASLEWTTTGGHKNMASHPCKAQNSRTALHTYCRRPHTHLVWQCCQPAESRACIHWSPAAASRRGPQCVRGAHPPADHTQRRWSPTQSQ